MSTDTLASLLIGSTCTLWTSAVLGHIYQTRGRSIQSFSSDQRTLHDMLAALAAAPLLVQVLFGFWLVTWLDGLRAEKRASTKPVFWSLTALRGPFDWESGVHRGFYWTLLTAICISVLVPALASIASEAPLPGILSLAGLIVFGLDGAPNNPYVTATHRYADDRLRVALPTSHHEGTAYVLPSMGIGFDAVWTPKVQNEHLAADQELMVLFAHMRSGRYPPSEPLERLRKTLTLYQERVILSTAQAERLAAWIYNSKLPEEPELRRIRCQRAAGVHLIGRDLMLALCHAEYLVFMAQGRLSNDTQSKLGTLRLLSRSGAPGTLDTDTRTVGFVPGYSGYKEAVEHVYAIFDTAIEAPALEFSSTAPPSYSAALSSSPSSIDEYVAQLWDLSIQHTESTFSALYFFTTVWYMELGNVNGFHIFPLRCRTRDGDLVSQQIAWRQAWYAGCMAQLISVGPQLLALFAAGFLE